MILLLGKFNYGKCWGRVGAEMFQPVQGSCHFYCHFFSLLRQFSSFPVSISVPGAGWAAEGLKRRINQTISKQDRVLEETYAICMFLPGKWAQTTLKRRSNDPGYILIKRDAQSLQQINIMILPLIRYAKMIRYATPKKCYMSWK